MSTVETALCLLFVIGVIALFIGAYLYDKYRTDKREEEFNGKVILRALNDLGLPDDTPAVLFDTGHCEIANWSKWRIYLYTLTIGEKIYIIGVQRAKYEIVGVFVECELKGCRDE